MSVCAFVSTALVDAVRAAGASVIGDIDLVQRIVSEGPKAITFDKVVATPDQMPVLSRAARVLGPRGLMPNPKVGTVTEDPASVVSELRGGRIEFRVDKHAMLHAGVGKAEWAADQLLKNVGAFVAAVAAAKPTKLKCAPLSPLYIKQCYIASTFGPGYHVQLPSLYETARLARD